MTERNWDDEDLVEYPELDEDYDLDLIEDDEDDGQPNETSSEERGCLQGKTRYTLPTKEQRQTE